MDFRTLCFCRPEGLAFSAVTIFQIGANMYKAFGGFAKFDRRYSPMTPRDSNNLKAKERNHVDCVAFEGQLFVDLMILYLGSRHLFVRTRFVRFLWLGFGSLLIARSRTFEQMDLQIQMLQPQCPIVGAENAENGGRQGLQGQKRANEVQPP